jgi:hypothetical protein
MEVGRLGCSREVCVVSAFASVSYSEVAEIFEVGVRVHIGRPLLYRLALGGIDTLQPTAVFRSRLTVPIQSS